MPESPDPPKSQPSKHLCASRRFYHLATRFHAPPKASDDVATRLHRCPMASIVAPLDKSDAAESRSFKIAAVQVSTCLQKDLSLYPHAGKCVHALADVATRPHTSVLMLYTCFTHIHTLHAPFTDPDDPFYQPNPVGFISQFGPLGFSFCSGNTSSTQFQIGFLPGSADQANWFDFFSGLADPFNDPWVSSQIDPYNRPNHQLGLADQANRVNFGPDRPIQRSTSFTPDQPM